MTLIQKMIDVFKNLKQPQHSAFMKEKPNKTAGNQGIVDMQSERFAPLTSLKVAFLGGKAG